MICRLRCITRSSRLLTGWFGGHQVTEAALQAPKGQSTLSSNRHDIACIMRRRCRKPRDARRRRTANGTRRKYAECPVKQRTPDTLKVAGFHSLTDAGKNSCDLIFESHSIPDAVVVKRAYTPYRCTMCRRRVFQQHRPSADVQQSIRRFTNRDLFDPTHVITRAVGLGLFAWTLC